MGLVQPFVVESRSSTECPRSNAPSSDRFNRSSSPEVCVFRGLSFLIAATLLLPTSAAAQSVAADGYSPRSLPSDAIQQSLREKADVLEMRVSGNRGTRGFQKAFQPAWARTDDVEQELWVYGASARNRVALAAKIAKRVELNLDPQTLPPDLVADEVHVIVPIRLYRGDLARKDGSGEELLNVSLKPNAELVRQFEPDADYRRLLALPPDWDLRVYAYAPNSIAPGTAVNVFYTRTKKKDAFNRGHLR